MSWLGYLEGGLALLALIVVCPLLWLFLRRRWLSTRGGLFDCGLRVSDRVAGGGWALGLARYEGNVLEWYRVFSFRLRPQVRIERSRTSVLGRRDADQVEALVLFSGHDVVRLRGVRGDHPHVWELAMSPASVTGLLSWLEAGPPGGDRYPGVE